ncbi:MAG: hypothetical protein ACTSUE_15995 [Promethearchaeota archaeon]
MSSTDYYGLPGHPIRRVVYLDKSNNNPGFEFLTDVEVHMWHSDPHLDNQGHGQGHARMGTKKTNDINCSRCGKWFYPKDIQKAKRRSVNITSQIQTLATSETIDIDKLEELANAKNKVSGVCSICAQMMIDLKRLVTTMEINTLRTTAALLRGMAESVMLTDDEDGEQTTRPISTAKSPSTLTNKKTKNKKKTKVIDSSDEEEEEEEEEPVVRQQYKRQKTKQAHAGGTTAFRKLDLPQSPIKSQVISASSSPSSSPNTTNPLETPNKAKSQSWKKRIQPTMVDSDDDENNPYETPNAQLVSPPEVPRVKASKKDRVTLQQEMFKLLEFNPPQQT